MSFIYNPYPKIAGVIFGNNPSVATEERAKKAIEALLYFARDTAVNGHNDECSVAHDLCEYIESGDESKLIEVMTWIKGE